ncbi:MAG: hypothetical protein R3324_05205 [Halobacteriales archaeon]|nr:hypothetical protein [Halobacteriales archaeon]
MQDAIYGAAVEILEILGYALATGLLTGAGVVAEATGIESLLAGDSTLGLWLAFMGLIAIYAGIYQAGNRHLRPAVHRLLTR